MKCIQALFALCLFQQTTGRTTTLRKQRNRDQEGTTDVSRQDDEFRIVGGTNAPAGRFPFMVRGGGCGGSLIAPNLVLSAAHCEGTFSGTLRIGSVSRNSGGETARANRQVIHPNYVGSNNDFMVIVLDRNVQATPVSLNGNENTPDVNDPLTVIGFGRTSEGGSSPDRLQQVTVPYVSHDQCRGVYGNVIQEDTMLCAGTEAGGRDSCQGDSGGPIMNSAGVQVGVVSFGSGCARPGIPGVYARTSGAIDWINQMICEHSPDSCPGAGKTANIRVEVTHDGFPMDSGWTVTNEKGMTVMRQVTASVTEAFALATQSEDLPSGTYVFRIEDTFGDGICCQYGNGGIQLFGNDRLFAENDGQYGSSHEITFTIPDGNRSDQDVYVLQETTEVTTSLSCSDSSEDNFSVNDDVGEKDCSWLSSNLDYFEYLCEFVTVASTCPKTCGDCSIFK